MNVRRRPSGLMSVVNDSDANVDWRYHDDARTIHLSIRLYVTLPLGWTGRVRRGAVYESRNPCRRIMKMNGCKRAAQSIDGGIIIQLRRVRVQDKNTQLMSWNGADRRGISWTLSIFALKNIFPLAAEPTVNSMIS